MYVAASANDKGLMGNDMGFHFVALPNDFHIPYIAAIHLTNYIKSHKISRYVDLSWNKLEIIL